MMDEITFRPLTRDDLPMLCEWLTRPHVAAWWSDPPASLADAEQDFIEDQTKRPYIALLNGAPIGYIQSYVAMGCGGGWWEEERDPGVRGIDQFLADAHQLGRGLGTRMVRAFVERLFADPAVTHIQTDPSPANARAIRCYEKAGFQAKGVVETPDGAALLMICRRG